jgi:DNA modification methylase
MIRASTRPGDTVWVPFGGTLRELVAAERMARSKPKEGRRVITCELNQDGVDYLTPAIAQAQGLATTTGKQTALFGGAP